MAKKPSDKKMSEICSNCNGSGREEYEVAELIRDPKGGKDLMITRKKTRTCSLCKGYGESPTL